MLFLSYILTISGITPVKDRHTRSKLPENDVPTESLERIKMKYRRNSRALRHLHKRPQFNLIPVQTLNFI